MFQPSCYGIHAGPTRYRWEFYCKNKVCQKACIRPGWSFSWPKAALKPGVDLRLKVVFGDKHVCKQNDVVKIIEDAETSKLNEASFEMENAKLENTEKFSILKISAEKFIAGFEQQVYE